MSTSKLQRYISDQLSIHFGGYVIKENYRPDWLITNSGSRLELDFYVEELNFAIEVQGRQHYIYVPHFHKNYDRFLKRLEWDKFKRYTCLSLGIELFEITNKQDFRDKIMPLSSLPISEKRTLTEEDACRMILKQYSTIKGNRKRMINSGVKPSSVKRFEKLSGYLELKELKKRITESGII